MDVMDDSLIESKDIKTKIHTIRGSQVILDMDLATLYGVETRALKQAVRRNRKRFPADFMFVLSDAEVNTLVSQSVIPFKKKLGGALPQAFTEQGVSSLATILRSDKAIQVSIQIIRAFVALRRFVSEKAILFQRLDRIELKQLVHDDQFKKVFAALVTHEKAQGVFFDGKVFDAYVFVCSLIKSAKQEILLVDNYPDESVLTLFSKRKPSVEVIIYTKRINSQFSLDLSKFNSQHGPIQVKEFNNSHDRFMIIDKKDIYHFGASLKDLGKKWFAFSKFETGAVDMLKRLGRLP